MNDRRFTYAVIGGGIAGVSCVEQILEIDPDASILLISSTPVVKEASNVTKLSKTIEDFIVVERSLRSFRDVHQTVRVLEDCVVDVDADNHTLQTKTNGLFLYRKLCFCTGASPKLINFPSTEELSPEGIYEGKEFDFRKEGLILSIRDTESVSELTKRIGSAKRVLLVGNGGIATELVYELENVDVVWVIKDKSISFHYMDSGAAEFFIQAKLKQRKNVTEEEFSSTTEAQSVPSSSSSPLSTPKPCKRRKYTITSIPSESSETTGNCGIALGPDWHTGYSLKGNNDSKTVTIEYQCEIRSLARSSNVFSSGGLLPISEEKEWGIVADLTNGKSYGVDLVISATGVNPNCERFPGECDPEKGIFVNAAMRTNLLDVYAAGDVCCPTWPTSKHWFQMRLWTQARQMGLHVGRSMILAVQREDYHELGDSENVEDNEPDFCFELFTHVTRFFGFKVVLLGLYNGQGIDPSRQHLLLRCTNNVEYIKVVLEDWRMQGAILIGDTGLEETFENLILNQVDLSSYGEDLLNPDIDIEDYFD